MTALPPDVLAPPKQSWSSRYLGSIVRHGIINFFMIVILLPLAWVLMMSFKVLPKTRFGKAMILAGPTFQGSAAATDPGLGALLHKQGTTLSPLRPAGYARIDGRKIDVVTRGELLDAHVPVVVVEVAGNRVVVAKA